MTDVRYPQTHPAQYKVILGIVSYMDDKLVLDSRSVWVRKTAQLVSRSPILPEEYLSGLPCAADQSSDYTNGQD